MKSSLKVLLSLSVITIANIPQVGNAEIPGWNYQEQPHKVCSAIAGMRFYSWDGSIPYLDDAHLLSTASSAQSITFVGKLESTRSDSGVWVIGMGDRLGITPDFNLTAGCN